MKKRIFTFCMMFVMCITCIIPFQGVLAADDIIDDSLIETYEHEHEHEDFDCSVTGEIPITPADWPWTDCSNILGHDWGSWVEQSRSTSHPDYCQGFYLAVTSKRTCGRTNCGKTETITQYGVNNRLHQWSYVSQTVINGRPYNNYRCSCGATSQSPA